MRAYGCMHSLPGYSGKPIVPHNIIACESYVPKLVRRCSYGRGIPSLLAAVRSVSHDLTPTRKAVKEGRSPNIDILNNT